MISFTHGQRVGLLLVLAVTLIANVFLFLPPVAQDLDYHHFADRRGWLGIPNFGDVAGNIAFLISGFFGMLAVRNKRRELSGYPAWLVFFLGVFLTGLGSAYYHLMPNNETLVWDRLPMTVAFMALFSLIIMERIDKRSGQILLPLLLAIGVSSVFYWHLTEQTGQGDLRAYALVQFLPMILIFVILILFPAQHRGTKYLAYTLIWYVIAKLTEHFDRQIFDLTAQTVSGHTLKHIAAAIGTTWMVPYMKCTASWTENITTAR